MTATRHINQTDYPDHRGKAFSISLQPPLGSRKILHFKSALSTLTLPQHTHTHTLWAHRSPHPTVSGQSPAITDPLTDKEDYASVSIRVIIILMKSQWQSGEVPLYWKGFSTSYPCLPPFLYMWIRSNMTTMKII